MTESKVTESIELTPTPGQLLSAAREARSLTQQEVAKQMRLPTQTICDIDRDALAELGARTYVRGYLAAYARIVDISEEQILKTLDKSDVMLKMPMTRPAIIGGAPMITNVTRQYGGFRFKSSHVVGISVLVLVGALTFALWPNKKTNTMAPVVMHSVKKNNTFSALSSFNNTANNNTDSHSSSLVPTDQTLQDVTITTHAPAPTTPTQHVTHNVKQITAHNGFIQPINGLRPTYTLSPVENDTETRNS